MIDEVLYMQVRIFRMFCERTSIDPQVANRLFLQAGVWRYIAECFDILHLGGDELVYEDVLRMLRRQGVAALCLKTV